jgi:hypothetical protein
MWILWVLTAMPGQHVFQYEYQLLLEYVFDQLSWMIPTFLHPYFIIYSEIKQRLVHKTDTYSLLMTNTQNTNHDLSSEMDKQQKLKYTTRIQNWSQSVNDLWIKIKISSLLSLLPYIPMSFRSLSTLMIQELWSFKTWGTTCPTT